MAILIGDQTRILVQGITGREAVAMTRGMLDYGGRVVAGVTPGKGGQEVHGVPVFDSVRVAIDTIGPVDVSVVSVPPAGARDAAFEAIHAGIPLVVVTTERIPRQDVVQFLNLAAERGVRVIGPNTMGLISPGKSKAGSVGGPADDTLRSYRPGLVGIMSRSGGMTTEIASLISLNGFGHSTCISIGGDPMIGSTFADLYPLFDADPETGVVVMYTEPGGSMEAELAEYLRRERPVTPGVVFVAGKFMDQMQGVRFGHAGTIVEGKADSAAEKIRLLREAGLYVAEDLSDVPALVRQALAESRKAGDWAAEGANPRESEILHSYQVQSGGRVDPNSAARLNAGRGLFVDVTVAKGCTHAGGCGACLTACPVDIFKAAPGGPVAVQGAAEDECILCDLCVVRCPEHVITVTRLYAKEAS